MRRQSSFISLSFAVLLLAPLAALRALEPVAAFAPGTRILFQ